MTPPSTETVAIYRYTLTLKTGENRTCNAMAYLQDGPWLTFDDLNGSVLTIRHDLVDEVHRGEQVGEQEVETL